MNSLLSASVMGPAVSSKVFSLAGEFKLAVRGSRYSGSRGAIYGCACAALIVDFRLRWADISKKVSYYLVRCRASNNKKISEDKNKEYYSM